MKKLLMALLCVLLTLAMVLSLAACGEESKGKSKDDDEDDEKTSENGGKDDDDDDNKGSSKGSPEQVARDVIDMMMSDDYSNIASLLSGVFTAEEREQIADELAGGRGVSVDEYTIVSAEVVDEMSADDLAEQAESWVSSGASFDPDKLQEMVTVEITVKYDGKTETNELTIAKYNGKWGYMPF